MSIQKINSQPAFSGKLSANTVKKFAEALGDNGLKTAGKFRAGKNKHDNIDVIYHLYPEIDIYKGKIPMTDTYMEVSNSHSKKPPVRLLLAKGKMPFGQDMLDLIRVKMKIVDKLKNKTKV